MNQQTLEEYQKKINQTSNINFLLFDWYTRYMVEMFFLPYNLFAAMSTNCKK